jgi:phage terminase large subunit
MPAARRSSKSVTTAQVLMGEKFARALFTPARHKAFYGGRGSAKSWSVATYLAVKAAKEKKKIVCARQFQNSIRDSSKDLVEKRITALGLGQQYVVTERSIIHTGTKSQFGFIGLERNIDSIRSLEGADIVWVEEARTTKSKSMEVLLPTVRGAGSELIWTWNPVDPTDPVDAYFRQGTPPPRSIVTYVDYTDNPFFHLTEMPQEMEVLRQGNYERYKHVWLGEYDLSYESKVFPNVRIDRVEVPPTAVPLYGLDFGFGSDPSFMVKVYLIGRTLYIAAEAQGRVPMEQLPDLVRSVVRDDGDLVKADSSQPGTIEFLNSRGLNVVGAKKGPGSVKSGILFLQGHDIVIDPNCEGMREEARLYSWMTDRLTGKALSMPVDQYNHGWDAARYATESAQLEDDDDPTGGALQLKLW